MPGKTGGMWGSIAKPRTVAVATDRSSAADIDRTPTRPQHTSRHNWSGPVNQKCAIFSLAAAMALMPPALLEGQACPAGGAVAFIGVDVLTMTDSVLRRRQTVLVEGEHVTAIGRPRMPKEVCSIDASGMVLLPGLADMHAHMTEADLPLYLANGVTMVREMNGSARHIELRDRIARKEVLGPRLIVASPLLTAVPLRFRHTMIATDQDAYAAAHRAKDGGFEFLKIYDGLSVDSYEAFVEAGRRLGLRLDGHIPAPVGLARVLATGQSIQHIDKIVMAMAGHRPDTLAVGATVDRFFGRASVWVTPTVASLRALDLAGSAAYAERLRQPQMAYVDSATMGWWRSLAGSGNRSLSESPYVAAQRIALRALRGTPTRFLLGTDHGNPLMVAGFSVHEEMAALVRLGGFTPYEVLLQATSNAAEFMGDSLGGRIVAGAPANLVLVRANPLADLALLERPVGVMVRGRWLDRAELDRGLEAARRRVQVAH
jgi:hypothetical protein